MLLVEVGLFGAKDARLSLALESRGIHTALISHSRKVSSEGSQQIHCPSQVFLQRFNLADLMDVYHGPTRLIVLRAISGEPSTQDLASLPSEYEFYCLSVHGRDFVPVVEYADANNATTYKAILMSARYRSPRMRSVVSL